MVKLEDGTGGGSDARIDKNNRLHVRALIESEAEGATDIGDSYNVNTGLISSVDSASALLYIKNNEDQTVVVTAIAMGIGSGTPTNPAVLTVVRNPTAGTIIDNAVVADLNQNRNFGSNQSLAADIYKGVNGDTFTNGDDFALFFQTHNGRLFAGFELEMTKGDSLGLVLDPQIRLGSGSVVTYMALILHLKEAE